MWSTINMQIFKNSIWVCIALLLCVVLGSSINDEKNTEKKEIESIIQAADYVVVGSLTDYHDMVFGAPNVYRKIFKVKIDEVLKGKIDDEEIYVYPEMADMTINGVTYASYPCLEAPDIQEGKSYLLCLTKTSEENVFRLTEEIAACAVIQDEVTYPRYNTEFHPFYNIEMRQIRNWSSSEEG